MTVCFQLFADPFTYFFLCLLSEIETPIFRRWRCLIAIWCILVKSRSKWLILVWEKSCRVLFYLFRNVHGCPLCHLIHLRLLEFTLFYYWKPHRSILRQKYCQILFTTFWYCFWFQSRSNFQVQVMSSWVVSLYFMVVIDTCSHQTGIVNEHFFCWICWPESLFLHRLMRANVHCSFSNWLFYP